MRRQLRRTKGGNDARKQDLPDVDRNALQRGRDAHAQHPHQELDLRPQVFPAQPYARPPAKHERQDHQHARGGSGNRRRNRGPLNAQSRAPHGKYQPQHPNRAGGKNQQRIADDVEHIGQSSQQHGRAHVARRTQRIGQHDAHVVGDEAQGDNAQIVARQWRNLRFSAHPDRKSVGDQADDGHAQGGQYGRAGRHLAAHALRAVVVARAIKPRRKRHAAHAHGGHDAAEQPHRRGVDRHGRGRDRAQATDHGRVDVLYQRHQQVFDDRRASQPEHLAHPTLRSISRAPHLLHTFHPIPPHDTTQRDKVKGFQTKSLPSCQACVGNGIFIGITEKG